MLHQISEHVYVRPITEEEIPCDRPRLYYIAGDQQSAAIDAGNSANHVEKFYGSLQEKGFRLPDYTILTHSHWDHTFGLHATTGISIASTLTNNVLREMEGHTWNISFMKDLVKSKKLCSYCFSCIQIEYPNLSEIKVVAAEHEVRVPETIDLGNVHVQIFPHDTPHCRDALLIYVEEDGVLIVGDADGIDLDELDGKYDLQRVKDWFCYLQKLDFQTIVHAHRPTRSKTEEILWLSDLLVSLQ